jgi:hypothetical protein
MKNVTITLDEALARWARVEAAKAGKSLSRWIAERLEEEMRRGVNGGVSQSWLDAPLWPSSPAPLPTRDDLYGAAYDRPGFRGHEYPDLQPGRSGASEGEAVSGLAEEAGARWTDREPSGSE